MGDLNQDGNLDMVTSSNSAGVTTVFLGKGDGTYEDPISYSIEGQIKTVAIANLDSNDFLELIAPMYDGSNMFQVMFPNY